MTAFVNIRAQSNANLNLKVRSSLAETQERINFLGYTARMEIRERKNGYVVLAYLSSEEPTDETKYDGTITFEDDGIFTLDLPTDVLENKIKPGTWYYDLVLTRPDGIEVRWLEGTFHVDGSTTINSSL